MKILLLALVAWIALQDPVAPAPATAPAPSTASNPSGQEKGEAPGDAPAAAETLPLITGDEAAKHLDERVTVKFEVLSSKLLKDQGLCFLNSKKNHRDPDDFAVVLKEKGLAAFNELKVDDPADFFRGKTIAVTGKVAAFRGKPQIEVESVDQIRVVVVVPEGAASEGTSDSPSAPPATTEPGSESPQGDDDGPPQ